MSRFRHNLDEDAYYEALDDAREEMASEPRPRSNDYEHECTCGERFMVRVDAATRYSPAELVGPEECPSCGEPI